MAKRKIKKELVFIEFPIKDTIIFTIFLVFLVFGVNAFYNNLLQQEIQTKSNINYIQAPHTRFNLYSYQDAICVNNVTTVGSSGSSMQPTIFTGNTLLIKKFISKEELREGMIVLFETEDGPYVHRISAMYENYIIVKGDNLNKGNKIFYENITGIIVGVLMT